jgi:hypothetical protein
MFNSRNEASHHSARWSFSLGATILFLAAASPALAQEVLQNDPGTCAESYGIGCSNGDGTSGNPNDIVECFSPSSTASPFLLTEATYDVSADSTEPDALSLRIFEWSGSGAPGALVSTTPLGPGDLAFGPHTIVLDPPLEVPTANFCLGIYGEATDDGFRILKSGVETLANTSWILAPSCGANSFTGVAALGFPGNWCMSATIEPSFSLEGTSVVQALVDAFGISPNEAEAGIDALLKNSSSTYADGDWSGQLGLGHHEQRCTNFTDHGAYHAAMVPPPGAAPIWYAGSTDVAGFIQARAGGWLLRTWAEWGPNGGHFS